MTKIISGAILGIEAHRVEVEVDVARGTVVFSTVGLPAGAVVESRVRVKSALENCGFAFPQCRVTVNLTPVNVHKDGPSLDLPIALSILVADGKIAPEAFADTLVVGELSLDGRVRPVRGVLSMVLMAAREGLRRVIVPRENAKEAAIVEGVEIIAVESLSEAIGCQGVQTAWSAPGSRTSTAPGPDMDEVRGLAAAKRALEVAAVGGLSVLLVGPPGAGRTLLARRLPGILPTMTPEERLEVTAIYSAVGLLPMRTGLVESRPFRVPHHSCSTVALFGNGAHLRPGEVTLAHNGVLFLDELPEFRCNVLDDLQVVYRNGRVDLHRADCEVHFPASFQLVASMNPCPCGWHGHPRLACTCPPVAVRAYWERMRPYLDLFDMMIEVSPLSASELHDAPCGDSSATIRGRVACARVCMISTRLSKAVLQEVRRDFADRSAATRVMNAIAALDGKELVSKEHVAEAKGYRRFAKET